MRDTLLEQVSSLETDRARLIVHESRLAGHLRADQDGVAEVRMLVGDVLEERRQLEARAPASQAQIQNVVGRAILQGQWWVTRGGVIVARVAVADIRIDGAGIP